MMSLHTKHILMLLENSCYLTDGRVRHEAQALVRAGYRVSVICPASRTRKQAAREIIDGVRVYRYPSLPDFLDWTGHIGEYSHAMIVMFLLSLFVSFYDHFDIIHAHNPPDTFVVLAAFYKLFGKRFVYDHHDLAPEMYIERTKGTKRGILYHGLVFFEVMSCRLADHVIVTNESYKTVAMERAGIPAERISIVRNGPYLHTVQTEVLETDLRPAAKTVIAYVGVMNTQDGADYFIHALYHLVYDLEHSDVACFLVGHGDMIPSLKTLTAELRLSDHVTFTGWVPFKQVAPYLSTADICVAPEPSSPYNDRSTVIKLMEYMAASKPSVSFDLPEHRYTAQDAALYAQPNDVRDFAQKIAFLIDHPEQGQEMGHIGYERIVHHLAWAHQEPHLLNVYRTLQKTVLRATPNQHRG
jgi:glycosyltransferase involved in cell wall biosynthesis